VRHLHRLIPLGLLAALVMVLPASAQTGTFGLSGEDFQEFLAANGASTAASSLSFNYTVSLNVGGVGFPITAKLAGTGQLDTLSGQGELTINGTGAAGGPASTVEGELRVVDSLLYVRGTDPTTNTDTGWFSLSLDDAAAANLDLNNFNEGLLESFAEGFAEGAGVDQDELNGDAFLGMLAALGDLDPQTFIFMSREGPVFSTEFSLADMVTSPAFLEVSRFMLQAAALDDGSSDDFILVFNQLLADAFAQTSITLNQTVGADGRIERATFTIDTTIDPADFDTPGEPISVQLMVDVTVSGYGQPASVTAPANAQEIPVSVLQDAFGVAEAAPDTAAPDTGAVAPGAPASPVELTCNTGAQTFDGGPGTAFTGTCPAGCTAGIVWGTNTYTDDSSVCTAAIHAGVLTEAGGPVTFVIEDGQAEYPSSEQNGIISSSWPEWPRSFSFQAAGSASAAGSAADADLAAALSGLSASGNAGGDSAAPAAPIDLGNSYSFPNGVTFSYPGSYEILTESDLTVVLNPPGTPEFIQVYDTRVLFGDNDLLGLDFMQQTYGGGAAATWSFDFSTDDFVTRQVNGREVSVLEFEGTQTGDPALGTVAIVEYSGGGYGYVIAYAVNSSAPTLVEDALNVVSSLDG
jgi:hypothetical protein